jgi:hypothetical protein
MKLTVKKKLRFGEREVRLRLAGTDPEHNLSSLTQDSSVTSIFVPCVGKFAWDLHGLVALHLNIEAALASRSRGRKVTITEARERGRGDL